MAASPNSDSGARWEVVTRRLSKIEGCEAVFEKIRDEKVPKCFWGQFGNFIIIDA